MPSTTLTFAFAYLVLGVAGFVLTGSTHKTALIPCIFGVLFLIFGLLARKDNLRKHVMHAAVLIALLAFLGTARSLSHLPELFNGAAEKPAAIITQSLNAALSLLYIILAVRSFIQARRARSS
jgi:fucose 4-O-acetylase-like acetyltransferase